MMERAAWTNERLDDLAEGMRAGFARLEQDFRDLRTEGQESIRDLRVEIRDEFRALHALLFRIGGGIIIALIGVIAAIFARGA